MIPKVRSRRLSIGVVEAASYWATELQRLVPQVAVLATDLDAASEQFVGNLSRSPLRIVKTVDRLSAWLEARQGWGGQPDVAPKLLVLLNVVNAGHEWPIRDLGWSCLRVDLLSSHDQAAARLRFSAAGTDDSQFVSGDAGSWSQGAGIAEPFANYSHSAG